MLAMQPLNLNDILRDMTDMLRSLLHGGIALTVSLADDLGTALGDREQIVQIMLALVTNAGDAMPGGGELTIKTANLELAEAHLENSFDLPAGRYVLLEISDTGVGMSPEVQAHLFEPFFSTKGLAVGTGLGLASVYGIVKQFGGEIEVQSEEGQGTAFSIYLPNIDADPERVAGGKAED